MSFDTATRRVQLVPSHDDVMDAGFVTVLMVLAIVGFRTTYSGWQYLMVGVVGTVLGLLIAHIANALKQPLIALAAMALVAFFLLGGAVALRGTAVAGILPSGSTFHGLADQSVHGWKDLLTTLPPVDGSGPLLVLPYLLGLLGGVGGLCLARRTRPAFAPVTAPFAVLVVVILLGSSAPAALTMQGGVFGAIALGWAALRAQRLRPPIQNGSGRWSRFATAGALLVVAGAGALLVGPHVPGTGSHKRVVLRSYVAPPFDIGQYPSPLAGFRKYTEPAKSLYNRPLFTIRGLPVGTPVRIATLDDYDGLTWRASNQPTPGGSTPDTFQRVGSTIANPVRGRTVSYAVTIDDGYSDVWLPDAGALTALRFAGAHSGTHESYFRYDLATSTGIVPDRLGPRDRYTARAVLTGTAILNATDPVATTGVTVETASAFLRAQALQWSGQDGSPAARILALAKHLYSVGKYSDGEHPNEQYLPGHYEGRLLTFVNDAQIVGDDEQYAAAFALMVNQLGVPARVVLGAHVGTGGVVKGKNVHAWVEVALSDGTWATVPETAFMNRDRRPDKQQPQPQAAAPNQIVPPPSRIRPRSTLGDVTSADTRSMNNTRRKSAGHGHGFRLPAWVLTTGRWAGPPFGIILACCAAIVGLKASRRRRRRTRGSPAVRLAHGWREIVDHARDLGAVMPGGRTRREQAALLTGHDLHALASSADAHVFGAAEPGDAEAEAYWRQVEATRRQMSSRVGRWRRLRATVSLSSLRKPHGIAEVAAQ